MTTPAMTSDDYKRLADELDGWHDCADGDVSAGNGHFRVVCESDSEQQRLNLRATLRDAASALRAASVKAGEVVAVKPLEWQRSHVSPWQDDWHTTGPFTYTIRCADENGWKWSSGYGYGWCNSADTAKAAAQANYEARIRSALVVEPAPTASVGAMREALLRDQWSILVEKDDRTAPEEYPDMCLITQEEVSEIIDAALAAANQSDGLCPVPLGKNAPMSTETASDEGGSYDSAAARRMPGSESTGSLAPAIAASQCENGVSPGPSDTPPAPQAVEAVAIREALIAAKCDTGDGTYIHCSMDQVVRALLAKSKVVR